jgi:hypothetical protein
MRRLGGTTMRLTIAFTSIFLCAWLAGCTRDKQPVAPTITASPIRTVRLAPSFVDNGSTLTAAGTLSDLGKGDLVLQVNGVGHPSAKCTAEGKPEEPIDNLSDIALTASTRIPASAIHDGTAKFVLNTATPPAEVAEASDCKDGEEWKERIDGVALKSAVITVEQDGMVVLTLACIFATPTADGQVPSANVSCTPQ